MGGRAGAASAAAETVAGPAGLANLAVGRGGRPARLVGNQGVAVMEAEMAAAALMVAAVACWVYHPARWVGKRGAAVREAMMASAALMAVEVAVWAANLAVNQEGVWTVAAAGGAPAGRPEAPMVVGSTT